MSVYLIDRRREERRPFQCRTTTGTSAGDVTCCQNQSIPLVALGSFYCLYPAMNTEEEWAWTVVVVVGGENWREPRWVIEWVLYDS